MEFEVPDHYDSVMYLFWSEYPERYLSSRAKLSHSNSTPNGVNTQCKSNYVLLSQRHKKHPHFMSVNSQNTSIYLEIILTFGTIANSIIKQECIPVGCVPAARRPYAGVCFPGGCLPGLGGCLPGPGGGSAWSRGVCLIGGGMASQHALRQTPPLWTDRHL